MKNRECQICGPVRRTGVPSNYKHLFCLTSDVYLTFLFGEAGLFGFRTYDI